MRDLPDAIRACGRRGNSHTQGSGAYAQPYSRDLSSQPATAWLVGMPGTFYVAHPYPTHCTAEPPRRSTEHVAGQPSGFRFLRQSRTAAGCSTACCGAAARASDEVARRPAHGALIGTAPSDGARCATASYSRGVSRNPSAWAFGSRYSPASRCATATRTLERRTSIANPCMPHPLRIDRGHVLRHPGGEVRRREFRRASAACAARTIFDDKTYRN